MRNDLNILRIWSREDKKERSLKNTPKEEKPITIVDGVTGFIELLINKGVVTRQCVEDAIKFKQALSGNDKRLLFKVLIENFNVDREKVFKHFAHYYSFRTIDLTNFVLDSRILVFIKETLNSLPYSLREQALITKVLPFQVNDNDPNKLLVLTPDPSNSEVALVARSFPFQKFEICYTSLPDFEDLLHKLALNRTDYTLGKETVLDEEESVIDELEEEIRKGHLGELIDSLLTDAVKIGASDIHIIPKGQRLTEIYFRIDGKLNLWYTASDIRAEAISAVIKDQAKNLDRFERNLAQDGFAQKIVDGKLIRFRLSVIPIITRETKFKLESIVIRVLPDPEHTITIENLGFDILALDRLKKSINKPHGVVMLTGPTGSGKSTTLLAAVRAVINPSVNIITVEDPVEYLIDGARQVKLSHKLDFEGALRAILRHDPDIVMVGEIRDKTTADIAIKLANTGHLTFSTLHTNDAPSAIARLYKMGIEPFLIAYAINVIVAQRLVRKLCPRCKVVDHDVEIGYLEKIGLQLDEIKDVTFYKTLGCIHCVKGYKGRTAIAEVLYFTKEIRQLIMDAGNSINEEAVRSIAIKQGMRTLHQSGIELLRKGITSVEEIAATTVHD
jgi:type IV pilus assembly protein PilB